MTRITHRMTNRITIGTYLRDAGEPRTPRQIGKETKLDLTTITQALHEMEIMGLAEKTVLMAHHGRRQKSSPVAWSLKGDGGSAFVGDGGSAS